MLGLPVSEEPQVTEEAQTCMVGLSMIDVDRQDHSRSNE